MGPAPPPPGRRAYRCGKCTVAGVDLDRQLRVATRRCTLRRELVHLRASRDRISRADLSGRPRWSHRTPGQMPSVWRSLDRLVRCSGRRSAVEGPCDRVSSGVTSCWVPSSVSSSQRPRGSMEAGRSLDHVLEERNVPPAARCDRAFGQPPHREPDRARAHVIGDLATYLSGSETWRHGPVGQGLARSLGGLATLACRLPGEPTAVKLRLETRRNLDAPIQVFEDGQRCR